MRKIYEAPGMMEWHPEIIVGRSRIKVSFEGGHFSGKGRTPATFETSDPVVQTVLENSAPFISGRIRLAPGFRKGITLPASGGKGSVTTLNEMVFDNLSAARDYLTFEKNIPASEVMDAGDCVKVAAKVGINLKIKT